MRRYSWLEPQPTNTAASRTTMNTADDTGGARPGAIRGPLVVTNRHRWAIVGLLFTASLINYFDRATIAFALPLISRDLHLGPEAKGVLLSAFFWSYALMQIPMGVLADRVNLRWLYAVAFALWSVSQGLIGLATGLGTLIAFRVLLGVGEAIYLPGGSKIVSLLFRPSERGLPSGILASHLGRRGHADGPRDGGRAGTVAVDALRLAHHFRGRRVQRAAVADPVVRGRTARAAR